MRAIARHGLTALLAIVAAGTMACERRAERVPAARALHPATLVIAAPTELHFPDPLVSGERWTDEIVRNLLFLPLIRYDAHLSYAPCLAGSWEMEGDTAVVFHLRRDVFWHDGVKATAYDVAFTYERARDPKTGFPNEEFFDRWRGVQVQDSFTVRFRFEPHADPLAGLPFTPIAPRHLLDSIPPEHLRQAAFNEHPVGDGPFRFVEHRADDHWTFEANPAFPAELGGKPQLDRVVWRVVPDNTAQIVQVRTGEADLALAPPPDQVRQLATAPGLRLVVAPSRSLTIVAWNGLRPPFGDARVRRALSMAIDRRAILDRLRGGFGDLAASPIPSFHWAFDSTLAPLPHDPAAARALLAQAGYSARGPDGTLRGQDGKPLALELTTAATPFNRNLAEAIRADLARLGVQTTTRAVDGATLVADMLSPARRFDAVVLSWIADFRINVRDAFHSSQIGSGFQIASYRNPEVDRIIDSATLLPDRQAARPLWHRFQRILRDDQPWTFLYFARETYLVRQRVQGADMDIRGPFASLARWWIAAPTAAAAAPGS